MHDALTLRYAKVHLIERTRILYCIIRYISNLVQDCAPVPVFANINLSFDFHFIHFVRHCCAQLL